MNIHDNMFVTSDDKFYVVLSRDTVSSVDGKDSWTEYTCQEYEPDIYPNINSDYYSLAEGNLKIFRDEDGTCINKSHLLI